MSVMGFILFDLSPNRLTCCLSHDSFGDMFLVASFSALPSSPNIHIRQGLKIVLEKLGTSASAESPFFGFLELREVKQNKAVNQP